MIQRVLPESVKRATKKLFAAGRDCWYSRSFLFENLGREHLPKSAKRCLIGYVPGYVGYLCRHHAVGRAGWEPVKIEDKIRELSGPFNSHSMYWESAELVRQCIAHGYVVDYVCDRRGYLVKDASKYDLIIDEWTNLPAWSGSNPYAKKMFYSTGGHWIYSNMAELNRHAWLFERRGIDIPIQRQVPPLLAPDHADLISSFGNEAVSMTFGSHAHKIRKLWISAVDEDVPLVPKDWAHARRSFLWFGGGGWVHKGLDLAVEAFLKEPDLHLHIVGAGAESDPFFARTYGLEVSKVRNISIHGFMDVRSREFYDLCASCVALIYPSGSEGCSGGAVQCLHYGLIPLVTPIVGLEVHDRWPALSGDTDAELIQDIRRRCREVAEMPEAELEEWRYFFWEFARHHHTRDAYSESLSRVLAELLDGITSSGNPRSHL